MKTSTLKIKVPVEGNIVGLKGLKIEDGFLIVEFIQEETSTTISNSTSTNSENSEARWYTFDDFPNIENRLKYVMVSSESNIGLSEEMILRETKNLYTGRKQFVVVIDDKYMIPNPFKEDKHMYNANKRFFLLRDRMMSSLDHLSQLFAKKYLMKNTKL